MNGTRRLFLALTAALAVAGTALAQSRAPAVTFSGGSVSAGIGYTWDEGVIHFKGTDYAFTVKSLSVVDVGAAEVEGTDEVYNLVNRDDFEGTYAAAGVGATTVGGGSLAALENEHGVIIHFRSTAAGFRLNASGNAITIAFDAKR
jgi:hypothetical protein